MEFRIGSCTGLQAHVWANFLLCLSLLPRSFALDPAALHGELDQVATAEAQAPPGVVPFDVAKTEAAPPMVAKTEAAPFGVAPLNLPHTLAAQQTSSKMQAGSQAIQAPSNPVLQLYVQETKQYEKDAEEAQKAAEMYSKMSQELITQGALKGQTQALTKGEMSRVHAKLWAHSVYTFEKMLTDKTGSVAAAAFPKGGAPYQKMVVAYTKQQGVFDVAAQGYALRVGEILPVAKKLMTYANQYRLQGNDKQADDYDTQATSLMSQAEAFASNSKANYEMATELNLQVPGIQKMVGIAGTKAAYDAVKGAPMPIPQSHLFPFTPVPPLEFLQVGEHKQEETGTGKAMIGDIVIPPPKPPVKAFLRR